jgi:hypothetical protein
MQYYHLQPEVETCQLLFQISFASRINVVIYTNIPLDG